MHKIEVAQGSEARNNCNGSQEPYREKGPSDTEKFRRSLRKSLLWS